MERIKINNPRPDGRGFISLRASPVFGASSPDFTIGVLRAVIKSGSGKESQRLSSG